MASNADSDGFVPDEDDGFVPDAPAAPPVSTKPAQPFIPEHPPSFGESISASIDALTQPFKSAGRSLLDANDAAARAITSPVQTFGGGKAPAVLRETMRGVNSNIPFANDVVQAMGGPPAQSAADAAAAPGFQPLGGLFGTPVASMVGGVLAKPIEAAAPVLGRALGGLTKGAAEDRMVTRAVEDLGEKTRARVRANIKTEPVEELVRDNPAVRAAAGNDAKLATTIDAAKKKATADLDRIYSSVSQELPPSAAVANMDTRIAELASGTSEQREVARALKTVRDEFQEAHGNKTSITPRELRDEQTAYQKKACGKAMPGDEAATARIAANQEAQKAVGNAVLEHVTGLDYKHALAAAEENPDGLAAQLLKANKTVSAVNKIEAGIAGRAALVQPKAGIVGKAQAVGHAINHPGTLIPAIVDKGVRATDSALARFGGTPDGMIARLAQAAQQGNPWAQKQLRIVTATPAGRARVAALQAAGGLGYRDALAATKATPGGLSATAQAPEPLDTDRIAQQ